MIKLPKNDRSLIYWLMHLLLPFKIKCVIFKKKIKYINLIKCSLIRFLQNN